MANTFIESEPVEVVLKSTEAHPLPKGAGGTLIELLSHAYCEKRNSAYDGTLKPRLDDSLEELLFLKGCLEKELADLTQEIAALQQ